ncbi:MAG: hypothetical protein ACRC50_01370 [Gaiella sp.]
MRRAVVVLLLAALVGVPAGAAADAPESPESFMKRVLRFTVEARYAEAWTLLHPAHQRYVTKQRFARCRANDPTLAAYRLASSTLVSKAPATLASPGIPQKRSTRVVLRFRIADASQIYPATEATVNAVWTGSRWAWVLPAGEVPAFRSGRCPA